MTRKTFRNVLWVIAGASAIYFLVAGAYHQLATSSLIYVLGACQED